MLDHQDFFWRSAGNLVSVVALGTAVFHYHNTFQRHYQKYRQDVEGDRSYIIQKRKKESDLLSAEGGKYIMKKQWKEPKLVVQHFVPNEYVSACGTLDNGTVLYTANIEIVTAWERIPAGIHNYIQDDMLLNPHKIYRGSFYRDKEMKEPDATANGHEEWEDYGPKECVRENDKSPWGYHYHFKEVSNHS